MFLTQEAKDPKNIKQRKANLLKALREKRLLTLVVEPSSVCNLSCRFCDLHSGRYMGVKQYKGKMPLNAWKLLMSQIHDLGYQLEQLQIHGNGEPLLNKDIVEMVKFAKQSNIAKMIRLTTNGINLTPKMTWKLRDVGIDEIWVSIDIAEELAYKHFKGKNSYWKVQNNICAASALIEHSDHTSLFIKYPIPDSQKSYGIDNLFGDSVIEEFGCLSGKRVHLKGMPVVVMTGGKKIYTTPCEIPFYSLFVKYDGRVSLCCADFKDDLTVGNIHRQTLSDILRGNDLWSYRMGHLSGIFEKGELCRTCGNRTCVDLTAIKDEVRKLI